MKMKQEGKMYAQGFDLRFLDAHPIFPKNLKKLITFDEISLSREDEYFEISDPEFIKFLDQAYYIIDYDTYNSMTYEQISEVMNKNEKNIDDLKNKKLLAKKNKENVAPYDAAMRNLLHYKNSISRFMDEKNINKRSR